MKYQVTLNEAGGLCEIYQDVNIKFAFCEVKKESKEESSITQLHPWIICRDFLGDALFATHHKSSYGIYGFKWDGSQKAIPTNLTYMLIKHQSKEQLESIVRLINHMEKKVKWKRTKLTDLGMTSGGMPVFLAVASKKWVTSSALISLYTMLWRLCAKNLKEDENLDAFLARCVTGGGNDGSYLTSIDSARKAMGLKEHLFYTIMRHNSVVFKDSYEFSACDVPNRVHNYNGIKTLADMTKGAYTSDKDEETSKNYGLKTAFRLASIIKKRTAKKTSSAA